MEDIYLEVVENIALDIQIVQTVIIDIEIIEKGAPGDPGYVPVKGVDYFDGKDGLTTSVNGVQQEDGNISIVASNMPITNAEGHFASSDTEGALSELFTFANEGKTAVASAITDKGVSASSNDTFPTLANKIRNIYEYTPPADWIDIDDVVLGDINLLVCDIGLSTFAFVCTTSSGQYNINWGDGTNNSYNSGTTGQHTYTVGAGQACNRGYTTFKIVIHPVSGNLLTFKITNYSLALQDQSIGILACVCRANLLTSLDNAFNKQTSPLVYCKMIEYFKAVDAMPNLTSAKYFMNSCYALEKVTLPVTANLLDVSNIFENCKRLIRITGINMPKVTTAIYMVSGCSRLREIDVSSMVALQQGGNMISRCDSLKTIDIRNLVSLTSAVSMFFQTSIEECLIGSKPVLLSTSYMFSSCINLKDINLSGLVAVKFATSMFENCHILRTVDASAMVSVESCSNMFNSCYGLEDVKINEMTKANMSAFMFYECYALKSVLATNFGKNATDIDGVYMFTMCEQLTNISMPEASFKTLAINGSSGKLNKLQTISIKSTGSFSATAASPQFDISYCTLSAEQLNTIFTNLPTVTSKTIKINACTGASTCTRSIAQAKGWTVVG